MVHLIPVLLIDDDEEYVSLMKTILEGEGYFVDYAFNGSDGLKKVIPGKYAAIITDYVMPFLRGDEVADMTRRIDVKVGIILLTGYKSGLPIETLSRFNFVLEKPVTPMEILHALSELTAIVPQNQIEVRVS